LTPLDNASLSHPSEMTLCYLTGQAAGHADFYCGRGWGFGVFWVQTTWECIVDFLLTIGY